MLELYGTELVFDGVTIGKLTGGWPTRRERVEAMLDGLSPDWVDSDAHSKECDERYDNGRDDGIEEGRKEMEGETKQKVSDAYDEGFDAGRADALVDMERAGDAVRLDALIRAVSEAHDALFKVVHQHYTTAKLGEITRQAVSACSTLRLAVNAWRAPNGA